MKFNHPSARKETLVENIHGLNIPAPYRWMEDLESDETKKFVLEQQSITESYLKDAPNREEIKKSLETISNHEEFSCPFKVNDRYYYFRKDGLENQAIMYMLNDLNDEPNQFLNPNQLSKEGTSSINTYEFSEDGKWFAYAISDEGSDWLRIRIRNCEISEDLNEELTFCRFTKILWTSDNLGFFYSGYIPSDDLNDPTAKQDHKIFYHRLHTNQSSDFIAIEFPDLPNALLLGRMSDCGTIINIQLNEECRNVKWWYARFDLPVLGKLAPQPIINKIEAEYEPIANDQNLVYFRTNKNAANFKIARIDLNNLNDVVDIVGEHKKNVLNQAYCIDKDKLLLVYLKDVKQCIEIRQLKDGKLIKEFEIAIGCITDVECERTSSEFFFYFQSFLTPGTIYHFDFRTMTQLKVFKEIKLNNFNSADYTVKQVFYDSKDGITKVPMFIVHKNDLKMNGDNLAYLYAYGGFNIPIMPTFHVSTILLIKHFRGVFALANVRGGGEYGTNWYNAGRLLNKQNTLDDIQNAGEYLINEMYTSNQKLTIEGISNGGLMMQICSNQRPDLFACVITRVGGHDLLRYDKFTLGYLWESDFGKTSSKMHFKNLYRLTPLLNVPVKCDRYPNTLILTADHDTRVVPSHSYKLAATLQDKLGKRFADKPILLRVDLDTGHCDGKPTFKEIEEITDIFSFIQKSLNLKFYD